MKRELVPTQARTDLSLSQGRERIVLSVATERERQQIYRLRHEVYSRELGQYPLSVSGSLRDSLDDWNYYLVSHVAGSLVGFVSITPPGQPSYSIDKYVARCALPFPIDDRLYEVRLLTVLKAHRRTELAGLLMYAAYRWIEAHGGTRVMAIGRREVMEMYRRSGLEYAGITIQAGAVTYDLIHATVEDLKKRTTDFGGLLDRLESKTDWKLSFPFRKSGACFHGGQFFAGIGVRFDSLERTRSIINADVLDAWFPPSPRALKALQEYLPWMMRTSPPTQCEGLVEIISKTRGVHTENIVVGGGSSDLIFRALGLWLTPKSHALILDPTYGEYGHVLEKVVGCTVDRLSLARNNQFDIELDRLSAAIKDGYDLVVLVNPNSPTGRHVPRNELEEVLRRAPLSTRIWVDETYVDYVDPAQSLDTFAAHSENVIVCKSMSKAYALSGARVGYLCAGPHQLEELKTITPPWVVSLPGQVAAIHALQDPEYYSARYRETAALRERLASDLSAAGLDVIPGTANFLLCHLAPEMPDAAVVVKRCALQGVYLRNAATMSPCLGLRALRIAVKDASSNSRIIEVLSQTLELKN